MLRRVSYFFIFLISFDDFVPGEVAQHVCG